MAFDPLLPVEALKFLVAFTQEIDLPHASDARLRRLQRDIQRFINREAPGDWRYEGAAPNWRALEVLRRKADSMLGSFAETGSAVTNHLRTLNLFVRRHPDGTVQLHVTGDPEHRLAHQIVRVLVSEPDALKKCPGCNGLFVKVGKKTNCSSRCAQRLYMRKWRAGEVGGR